MAITSQLQQAGFPLTLEIKTEGLPKRSWVKISQIRTLGDIYNFIQTIREEGSYEASSPTHTP